MMIDLQRIQLYEHNPRHTQNPEYDRIKDSIRNSGLDQPLVITQRPKTADFIVHAGGNTRLAILRELNQEFGDTRFAQIPCLFRPWECESNVLLAHLRENDLRGNLTFIDKARAVAAAKDLFCEELDLKSVTQRRFVTELGRSGYRVSQSSLSLMLYTVEFLFVLIPRALEGGMGRDQIKRLRALERAGRALWLQKCLGEESAFEELFAQLCCRYDGEHWDNAVMQGALETEIAEASELNLHTIRAAFDSGLEQREVVIPEFVAITSPPEGEAQSSQDIESIAEDNSVDIQQDDISSASEISSDLPSTTTEPQPSRGSEATATSNSPLSPKATDPKSGDLKSMRARAWTIATRLAQRNGLGDLVLPLSGNGLGYVLRDVPDSQLADQVDETAWAQVCLLWWQLAACAEMTSAPLDAILPLLPEDSIFRRALKDDDAELLFESIWTLDPGHTGYRLWRLMPDRDWQDLIHLMDNYRCIRHCATETSAPVWSE